jgi:hypothetical protein
MLLAYERIFETLAALLSPAKNHLSFHSKMTRIKRKKLK